MGSDRSQCGGPPWNLRPLHRGSSSAYFTDCGRFVLLPYADGWRVTGRRDRENRWLDARGVLHRSGRSSAPVVFASHREALTTVQALLAAEPPALPARPIATCRFLRRAPGHWVSSCGRFALRRSSSRRDLLLTAVTEQATQLMAAAYGPDVSLLLTKTVREAQLIVSGLDDV